MAGWLLDGYGVPGIFWFLTILGLVMVALAMTVIPETSVRARESRPDFVGAGLLGVGRQLVAGQPIYTSGGFGGAYLVLGASVAAGGLVALLISRRGPEPVTDSRTLREAA